MKYIKKIILENFQSHKYTEVVLNEKLNVIVGPSDSGKTAIIRAIKWALYNEPAGDFFIREGEKEVSVILIFSDNTQLTRHRSKTKNVYELKYNNGEELRLEGFGTGVPDEIKESIGIYKINLDGKETNSISLAEQLEGPFLLSEKTSTRASAIGQLVGVDVIDEALTEVLKDVKTLNITKKNLEEEINQLNEEIKTYDNLEQLKITLKSVSNIREQISKSQESLDKLNHNHNLLKKLDYEISSLEEMKNKLNRLDNIDEILTSLESLYTKHWHLSNYNRNIKKMNMNIEKNEKLLKELQDIDLSAEKENKLANLLKQYNRLLNANKHYNEVREEILNLRNNLTVLTTFLNQEDSIDRIQEVYKRLLFLINLKDRLDKVKSSIDKGKYYIEKFKYIDDALEKNRLLEKNIQLLIKLNKLSEERLINHKNIMYEEESIKEINLNCEELIDKYKSILNNIEKCPLCFSEIDNDKIDHIMDHYIGG